MANTGVISGHPPHSQSSSVRESAYGSTVFRETVWLLPEALQWHVWAYVLHDLVVVQLHAYAGDGADDPKEEPALAGIVIWTVVVFCFPWGRVCRLSMPSAVEMRCGEFAEDTASELQRVEGLGRGSVSEEPVVVLVADVLEVAKTAYCPARREHARAHAEDVLSWKGAVVRKVGGGI